ncbi:Na+/H+ antiporter NhaA [Gordonia soli]|uniref:Na(+)/H(+) antiporter NhaA n=1 Tax=Gordonia soli NBRC 108243 TaxID=1223545 RepID=M0QMQ9_9ACTN|nr:Na+/H+ antiporter NhaA [Gordonia soli]GAC68702.1 Na(+)/H(+) antiporter NhaA [Gordonia soli NBRC 108243]
MSHTTASEPGAVARFRSWISRDTPSGALLLISAVLAVAWANSPWRAAYHSLADLEFGPESLHLHLSTSAWAADGLLAIFFFVVGVELKHEFVMGSLREPRKAGVPIAAAVGGMVVPALFYVTIVGLGDPNALNGWAIPTATDIAFALAVLAIFGRGLPRALRTFLLTLAVVDDLLGITIIATLYTDTIDLVMLVVAIVAIVVFAVLIRMRRTHWWLLVPVALVAWAFMHASGVHATVAGVLLGFAVPARLIHGEQDSRTHRFDDAVRPISSAIALPVFAFVAAGVTVVGTDASLVQPVSIGVFAGLVVGKLIGAMGVTALMTRFTPLRLPDAIGVRDLLPVGFLTGIGFTVALLIDELSFDDADPHAEASKAAILFGSLVAATLASIWLRWDARLIRNADMNRDGVPDSDIARIGD